MLWTPKQLKSEEMKWKETKLKTGANFKYITALISYCLDKSVLWVVLVFFFLTGHLFICYSLFLDCV